MVALAACFIVNVATLAYVAIKHAQLEEHMAQPGVVERRGRQKTHDL